MTTENVKNLVEEIDYSTAIIGIPFAEFVNLEKTVQQAKDKIKVAMLAANAEKKQAAIEEAYEILKALFDDE